MPTKPMTGTFARWKGAVAIVLAATLGVAAPASALDLSVQGARPAARGMAVPGAGQFDLENYRSIQNRENFQLEQRINREIDRGMNTQPVRLPEVPVVQPSCQRDIDGSNQTRACR